MLTDEEKELLKDAAIGFKAWYPLLKEFRKSDYKVIRLTKELSEKDRQIEELKAQLEKMKNCANCNHCGKNRLNLFCTLDEKVFTGQDVCSKWELKESYVDR